MPQKFVISESQLNRLVESENNNLKNIVSKSFDKNPDRFTKNLVDQIPELSGHEKKVKNKIVDLLLNNIGKVSMISLLVLWMSVYIPYIMKKNEIMSQKIEKSSPITSDPLLNFVKKFDRENPNWYRNTQTRENAEVKIREDFKEFVNKGGLSNEPFELSKIKKFDSGKSLIVFGRTKYGDSISVEFLSIVPTSKVIDLTEGEKYLFDLKINESDWIRVHRLAKDNYISLWSPTILTKGDPNSVWSDYRNDKFALGFYLAQVDSIKSMK